MCFSRSWTFGCAIGIMAASAVPWRSVLTQFKEFWAVAKHHHPCPYLLLMVPYMYIAQPYGTRTDIPLPVFLAKWNISWFIV